MKKPVPHFGNQPTSRIETVGPDLAAKWLEGFNDHNRPLHEAKARRYAADMLGNRWEFNGEAIIFASDGHLSDGQHRLWAVVLSGIAQTFVIVEGTSRHSQSTVDAGAARSAADQLHVVGIDAKASVAAAIRLYIKWHDGRLFGDHSSATNKVTTAEIVQWAEHNPHRVDELRDLQPLAARVDPVAPSVTLAVGLTFSQIDIDDTEDFLGRLGSGAGLEVGSPILALRNRLMKIKADRVSVSDKDQLGYFIQAWNAYRDGRVMTKIQRPRGAMFTHQNFPQPR